MGFTTIDQLCIGNWSILLWVISIVFHILSTYPVGMVVDVTLITPQYPEPPNIHQSAPENKYHPKQQPKKTTKKTKKHQQPLPRCRHRNHNIMKIDSHH